MVKLFKRGLAWAANHQKAHYKLSLILTFGAAFVWMLFPAISQPFAAVAFLANVSYIAVWVLDRLMLAHESKQAVLMLKWLLGLDPCWLTGHWWIHTHESERINTYYVVNTHESDCWRCGKHRKSMVASFEPERGWPPPDPESVEGQRRYLYLLRLDKRIADKKLGPDTHAY